jgi:hypothetical protein
MATGKELYTLAIESNSKQSHLLAFSSDGRILATPGKDNTVSLLEVATGKPFRQLSLPKLPQELKGGDATVQILAFSPDFRVLALSIPGDSKVHLWDAAGDKEIAQLQCGHVLAFSPDGRMLSTAVPVRVGNGGEDLAVTLWDVATCKEIGRLAGHRNVIRSMAFSSDGKILASGGCDLTCLVWDVTLFVQKLKPAAARPLAEPTLSKEQGEAAWGDLANTDAVKANRAVAALIAAPKQAIPLLKERLPPAAALADPKQLARWIADLDNESFAVRAKAQRAIEGLGEPAIPELRRAMAGQFPLEVKRRLQNILADVEPKLVPTSPSQLRQIRAVQVLESIATPEARQVLQHLAKGAAEVSLTSDAQAALERLDKRPTAKP